VPDLFDDEALDRISRLLRERLAGETLAAARRQALALARGAEDPDRRVAQSVGEALASVEGENRPEHVYLGGMANIATDEAFLRRESVRQMLEALERESEVLRLLREAATSPPVTVTIGRENPMTGMWEASVVAAPYEAGGQALGTIGVVGPLRMDYANAIAAVRAVAERLSAAVAALGG
jgi:heat-inducible transcriptional repressor